MGMGGMYYLFERRPPTVQQIGERLAARCGLRVDVKAARPDAGTLVMRTIDLPIDVAIHDDQVELLLDMYAPLFVWSHLRGALEELGGVSEHPSETQPPAWATRPWQELGLWRRFTLRYRGLWLWPLGFLVNAVLLLVIVPIGLVHEGLLRVFGRERRD